MKQNMIMLKVCTILYSVIRNITPVFPREVGRARETLYRFRFFLRYILFFLLIWLQLFVQLFVHLKVYPYNEP